ncbi:MAG: carboxylate-amine ligase [Persicimonas sp.]
MLEFSPSKPLTVGVEIEYQLVNARSYESADGILPLLEFYPDDEHIKPELVQETVEVASKPSESVTELEPHLYGLVSDLASTAGKLGLRLCGAGTHAFSRRLAAITPRPRYLAIADRSAYLAETRVTYATHVHIGVESPDEMIRIKRELTPYLPMFLALAANSPFWHGCQTGFASYRQRALAAVSSYGIPPTFDNWKQFLGFYRAASRSGMCTDVRDLHWDIRPQPDLGTVEIRVMDALSTVSEVLALTAFIRSLVAYLRQTAPEERPPGLPRRLPWWAQRENHFRTSHCALRADCIIDAEGDTERLEKTTRRVLELVAPFAREANEDRYLRGVGRLLDRPGYRRQIEVFEQKNCTREVSRAQVELLAADLLEKGGICR